MKRVSFGRLGLGFGILLQIVALSSASAFYGQAPQCLDRSGNELAVNNDQVVAWKTSTQNNYLNRAHVSGTVIAVYPNQTGHAHFGIQLDIGNSGDSSNSGSSSSTLEVIYDLAFGSIPTVQVGDTIEACGDYITAYAQSGHYPPSPDGALIHWIHRSDNPARHEDGFLMIDGNLYGQELPNN